MSLLLMAARARMNHMVSVGDPYWSNVVALLHFDGTNGATSFTDAKGNVWSANKNAILSTAQVLSGSASGSFPSDATGLNYFGTPCPPSFSAPGTFTLEAFLYITSAGSANRIIFQMANSANKGGMSFQYAGSALNFSQPFVAGVLSGARAVPVNTWTHVAACRDANNVLRLFVNGVQDTSVTTGTNFTPASPSTLTACVGGNTASTSSLGGYMDELRYTVGVARYTGSFTPPPAPLWSP